MRRRRCPASTARLRGERQRIGPVGLVHARGDRQVDDADVVGRLDRDRVVDRGDDVADVAATEAVHDLQSNQLRSRRNPLVLAVRVVTGAGDDARDVRAMAVVVVGAVRRPHVSGCRW